MTTTRSSRRSRGQDLEPQEIYDRIAQGSAAGVRCAGRRSTVTRTAATASSRSRWRPTSPSTPSARSRWRTSTGRRVNRPNLMIKIPVPRRASAIEQAIYEGINVNVTLLFAVEAYERVAEAYLRGLERRQDEGLPARRQLGRLRSSSPAWTPTSIRSSRSSDAPIWRARRPWPTPAPPIAASRRSSAGLAGRHCVTPARTVQRPLWASTGTKNAELLGRHVRRGLVGAHTVNTMPMATMMAFGRPRQRHRADRRERPERGPGRAGRGGDRHGAGDRRAARRRASSSSRTR